MISILWLDDISKDYTDLLQEEWFGHEGVQLGVTHEVKGPRGGARQAKCDITVKGARAELNYNPYEEFNQREGMIQGVMRIVFTNSQRTEIRHILWQNAEEKAFSKSSVLVGREESPTVGPEKKEGPRRGQVFTVAKLHYINGVVYKVAETGRTSIEALARAYHETTKSGNAKHPEVRVRTLVRLAEGVGLLALNKHDVVITDLGVEYHRTRGLEKWEISEKQRGILQKFILEDPYRTETVYAITTLLSLIQAGYKGDELSRQYAIEIGKATAWKSDVTFAGFTKFGLSYIEELDLMQVTESDLLAISSSGEGRYQEKVNGVNPIVLPEGPLPAPMAMDVGRRLKYPSNPRISKTALIAVDFKCELDAEHLTFRNSVSGNQYMEAHHLVPMSKQGLFEARLDVPENILSLCPTCHRKIHLADDAERKATVEKAYRLKEKVLPSRGIWIDFERLRDLYRI